MVAGFRWTPRYAPRPPTNQDGSDCCGTVPAHRSPWNACSNGLPSTCSTRGYQARPPGDRDPVATDRPPHRPTATAASRSSTLRRRARVGRRGRDDKSRTFTRRSSREMKAPKRRHSSLEEALIDVVARRLMRGKKSMAFVILCGDETGCAKVWLAFPFPRRSSAERSRLRWLEDERLLDRRTGPEFGADRYKSGECPCASTTHAARHYPERGAGVVARSAPARRSRSPAGDTSPAPW